MTASEKDEFRSAAIEEIARLEHDIASLTADTQPIAPDVSLGRLTRMDAIQNKSVAEAGLAASKQRLSRIQARLQQLESPSFDACSKCGKTIPAARILYLLDTDTCLDCASS